MSRSLNGNNNFSFIISPSLKIDHVHLRVSNLQEYLAFYQSIIGFKILKERSNTKTAFLGSVENNTNNNADFEKMKSFAISYFNRDR